MEGKKVKDEEPSSRNLGTWYQGDGYQGPGDWWPGTGKLEEPVCWDGVPGRWVAFGDL